MARIRALTYSGKGFYGSGVDPDHGPNAID